MLVKELKGQFRPIISDKDRLAIVQNIACVDFAFIIKPNRKIIQELEAFYRELYSYLDIDIVTSGPSEFNKAHKQQCVGLGIKYQFTGKNKLETTSTIIERIRNLLK